MKKLFILALPLLCIGLFGNIQTDAKERAVTKTEADNVLLSTSSKKPLSPIENLIRRISQATAEFVALRLKIKTLTPKTSLMKLQMKEITNQLSDIQLQVSSLQSELIVIKTDPTISQKQDKTKLEEEEKLEHQLNTLQSDLQTMKTELMELSIEEKPVTQSNPFLLSVSK